MGLPKGKNKKEELSPRFYHIYKTYKIHDCRLV
jgi:hypothetical protein